LTPVKEQLAGTVGVVAAEPLGVFVGRHVGADEPDLASLDPGVGVAKRRPARPQRLDLAPLEDDPALEGLEQVVVVPGAPVLGDPAVPLRGLLSGLGGPPTAPCPARPRPRSRRASLG